MAKKLIKIFLFSAGIFIIFLFVISNVAYALDSNCNGVDDDGDGQCDEDFVADTICDGDDTDSCREGFYQCPKQCGVAGVYCDDYTDSTVEDCYDCGIDSDCDGLSDRGDSDCASVGYCLDYPDTHGEVDSASCQMDQSNNYGSHCEGDNLVAVSVVSGICSCSNAPSCVARKTTYCTHGCEGSWPNAVCSGGGGGGTPAAPTWYTPNHKAATQTTSQIEWDWNSSDGANYYKIYKADETLIATGINVTEYTQTGLASANTQYGVKVKACNVDGCSGFSTTAYAYTSANSPTTKAPTNVTDTSITWNWQSGGKQSGYELRRENKTTLVKDTTKQLFQETGLAKCTSSTRYVGAYNGDYKTQTSVGDFVLQNTAMTAKTTGCNRLPIAGASAGGECDYSPEYAPGTSVSLETDNPSCPSSDTDGTIKKFEWDWTNNGSYDYSCCSSGCDRVITDDHCNTSHIYANAATANLRVTDDDGATATDTVNINICTIVCDDDGDCDDSNSLTKDTCLIDSNPCNNQCSYTPIISIKFWREILPKF